MRDTQGPRRRTYPNVKSALTAGMAAITAAAVGLAVKPLRGQLRKASQVARRNSGSSFGVIRGKLYRALGSGPDPDVSDDILADRVRSELGPVTKKLDLPHPHVSVARQVVTLHGDVATAAEVATIEKAVASTSGVHGVVSHLHEGLLRSDSRPSSAQPRLPQQSDALRRLLTAARDAGCPAGAEQAAVRTVMAILFEHLPATESGDVIGQLPKDVQRLTISPRRTGLAVSLLPNTIDTFVDAVASVVNTPHDVAHEVVVTILQALRAVLPEEARGIDTYLPNDLRDVWTVSPMTP